MVIHGSHAGAKGESKRRESQSPAVMGSGGAEIEVFVTSKAIDTSTAALETESAMTEVLAGEGKSLTNVPLLL